ncbi:MAG: hypothetical protein R3C05_28275 [Pirellulaceae bacterium]
MTVQNLLLSWRQPPNLEREDFPPRKQLYPFQMNLEPLSQRSLAKYVVTESPHNASGLDDIVAMATAGTGMDINRVGILYAILGVLFCVGGPGTKCRVRRPMVRLCQGHREVDL